MTARDDYPMLNVIRQDELEDEMWPTGTVWFKQHQAALDEIDQLRQDVAESVRAEGELRAEVDNLDVLRLPCPHVGLIDHGLHRLHDGVDGVWYDCPEDGYGCDGRMSHKRAYQMAKAFLASGTDHIPCDDDCVHAPMCPRWQT